LAVGKLSYISDISFAANFRVESVFDTWPSTTPDLDIGGIVALLMGVKRSVSAGVGFSALFRVATRKVIMGVADFAGGYTTLRASHRLVKTK
jgi:Cu/Ag efflux pump CusA